MRPHRVLLLDGSNVAARSFRASRSPSERSRADNVTYQPKHVFGLWTEYLAWSVEADLVVGVFDSPANRNKPASALFPFRSLLESRPGTMMTTSSPGQVADATIVNIASALSGVETFVASGDSDLMAVLAPDTHWLEILPHPSKSSPGGLVLHRWVLTSAHLRSLFDRPDATLASTPTLTLTRAARFARSPGSRISSGGTTSDRTSSGRSWRCEGRRQSRGSASGSRRPRSSFERSGTWRA